MFNIYTIHALPVTNENIGVSLKTSLSSLLNVSIPSFDSLGTIDASKLQQEKIKDSNEYSILHWKLIVFDNLHIIWRLISEDERKICFQKVVQFLLLKQ